MDQRSHSRSARQAYGCKADGVSSNTKNRYREESDNSLQIRKFREGFVAQLGRLRNPDGELVESNTRAETLADHLEKVQWAVRTSAVPPPRFSLYDDELPVKLDDVTEAEVVKAATCLKLNKASGLDDVPSEFWKAVTTAGTPSVKWIVEFCKACWRNKCVPEAWHTSRVAMLYKKGDPAECDNYRPISLLQIGYKLFAMILLERLHEAGAEGRIWSTQFGFRRGRGTTDALFLARRLIEDAWASKHGKVILLALDWRRRSIQSLLQHWRPPLYVSVVPSRSWT